jgi:predicted small integral membrane protein
MSAWSIIRRRLPGTVAFALLVALAGGAVLAALAGARRSETAAARLTTHGLVDDIEIDPANFATFHDVGRIERLPQVESATALGAAALCRRPCMRGAPVNAPGMFASLDGRFGTTMDLIDRLPRFTGRPPRQDRADEIIVNHAAARQLRLALGSVFRAGVVEFGPTGPRGFVPVDLHVVGIAHTPDELISNENQDDALIIGTHAFARRFLRHPPFGFIKVRLHGGARAIPSFEASLRHAFPGQPFDQQSTARELSVFARAERPYKSALQLFAIVTAMTALLVLGQAAWRLVRSDASDRPVLLVLGTTRGQRTAIAFLRSLLAIIGGAIGAVVLAVLLSPLFPLGVARSVEPEPGLRVDSSVMGVGLLAVVVALSIVVIAAAWIADVVSGDTSSARRPSRVVAGVAHAGAPPSAVTGVFFALHPDRNARSGSLFVTLFGLVVAITTTAAALTFGTNLDHFVHTPSRYGWTWDTLIESNNFAFSPAEMSQLRSDGRLRALTTGAYGDLTLNGQAVPGYGLATTRGHAVPVATAGRLPVTPNEIALGTQTMRELHTSVGRRIIATSAGGAPRELRVVGRTLLPSLARNNILGAAEGAVMTSTGLARVEPQVRGEIDFILADLAPNASLGELRHRYGPRLSFTPASQPGDIRSYDRVHTTPLILAALLALLGVGVLAHLLVTSVRARRHDLAVLKSLGFTRRQVSASVVWQATTVAAAALVIGIPVGAIAGRWSWIAFERTFGAAADPIGAPLALLVILVGTVVLANGIAAIPARAAARTRPTALLAVE